MPNEIATGVKFGAIITMAATVSKNIPAINKSTFTSSKTINGLSEIHQVNDPISSFLLLIIQNL